MCGISGVAGYRDISATLVDSIKQLEYRGYDSCGVAILNGSGNVSIKKNIGGVEEVARKEDFLSLKGKTGIAHTRWATHGKVTLENTHPHSSCDSNFVIVHNGIISNYGELKEDLLGNGHRFVSMTDTEVIVHLIEQEYKQVLNSEEALVRALKKLDGTYAVVMMSVYEPGKIFCAKYESPLVVGIGDEENYIGSDVTAFINYTKNTIILDDGELAIVTRESCFVRNFLTGDEVDKEIVKLTWDTEMTKKGGYPHYMLKEIYEQPQTIRNVLKIDSELIKKTALMISDAKQVYLTGVGTTYYVSQFGEYQFAETAGIFTPAISSDEFKNLAILGDDSLVFALSQSGETYDTLSALRHSQKKGCKTAAIVNAMGSSMARLVDTVIHQGSGPEICVISTKAALAQMIVLVVLAHEVALIRGRITEVERAGALADLALLPDIIEKILSEKSGFINTIAKEYSKINNWLYLGRGKYYPIALESALKMKEVAYVHAEGMPAGFLKHGTIALIDENLYSVIFVPPKHETELYNGIMSSAEEIRARDGFVLGFHFGETSQKGKIFNEEILLPECPVIAAPFVEMIVAQLFSYFTATALKRNVDKPRSLAKSVTVG